MRKLLKTALAVFFSALISIVPISAIDDGGKIVVVLDAGHGGMDGGTDAGIKNEKIYNLLISQFLKSELEADGRFDVKMTREDDEYLKMLPRAAVGLSSNADLFLSLHCNSNGASYVNGCEAYISVVDEFSAWDLSELILKNISSSVDLKNNGTDTSLDTGDSLGIYYWNDEKQWDMPGASSLRKKSDYYSINTWCSKFGIRSIIIEHAYLTNSSDAELLDDENNLKKIAKAEAEALIEYYFGHEHEFSEVRLVDHLANCTLEGASSFRCKVCGVKKDTVSIPIDPDMHYWRQVASARATCVDDGYIEWVCQISHNLNDKGIECEVHRSSKVIEATGHSYETIEDTPSGHGFNGLLYKKCTNCGEEIREVRQGESHSYDKKSEIIPTCVIDGEVVYVCKICGEEVSDTIPALGHDYHEKTRVEPENAAKPIDGYILYKCAVCGDERKEILPACQHEYAEPDDFYLNFAEYTADSKWQSNEIIDGNSGKVHKLPIYEMASCEKGGRAVRYCLICGSADEFVFPATGHSYVVREEELPLCESNGYRREECTICGDIRTEKLASVGHKFEFDADSGMDVCQLCGTKVERIPDDEVHQFSDLFKRPFVLGSLALAVLLLIILVVLICSNGNRKRRKHN